MEVVEGQPDPCIGYIDGVSVACCGHGNDGDAYVSFYLPDGSFVAWDGGFTRMTKEELEESEGAVVDVLSSVENYHAIQRSLGDVREGRVSREGIPDWLQDNIDRMRALGNG